MSSRRWLIGTLAIALLIGELPVLLATCCAPAGATGLGTVWFVNDFAQYESAMRQGAEQAGWLVRDPFTAEPHAPAFMFPLYVGIGKLAVTLHLPATGVEHVIEILARVLLVLALWRFCRAFASDRVAAAWALELAASEQEATRSAHSTFPISWRSTFCTRLPRVNSRKALQPSSPSHA